VVFVGRRGVAVPESEPEQAAAPAEEPPPPDDADTPAASVPVEVVERGQENEAAAPEDVPESAPEAQQVEERKPSRHPRRAAASTTVSEERCMGHVTGGYCEACPRVRAMRAQQLEWARLMKRMRLDSKSWAHWIPAWSSPPYLACSKSPSRWGGVAV
jgi:hypothetical protein